MTNKDQIRSALQQATMQPKRKSVTKYRFITNRSKTKINQSCDRYETKRTVRKRTIRAKGDARKRTTSGFVVVVAVAGGR
jgi:hypothetical protein